LFSSIRPGSFLLFFRVLYVRSLQTVHAREITGRFSAFATWIQSFVDFAPLILTAATLKQGLGTGGSAEILLHGAA
jgi:hypothetical protein